MSKIQFAQRNDWRQRVRAIPHHRRDNHRCLKADCDCSVYHDGVTYFSLCLLHLQELNLGPFKPPANKEDSSKDADATSLVFDHIYERENR